jgi:hypothetical protein
MIKLLDRITIRINNAFVGTRHGKRLHVKRIDPNASK